MKTIKRPEKGNSMNVRIPLKLDARVRKLAPKEARSISSCIVQFIIEGITKREKAVK